MKTLSGTTRLVLALAAWVGLGSIASAQEWHISDWGESASLPERDNDGPGNRMGTSSCNFVMDRAGRYDASLLIYKSRGMEPYSAARYGAPRSWQILELEGSLESYQPMVKLYNYCVNPNDPSQEAGFESDWFLLTEDWSEPVRCADPEMQVVQTWCVTAAYW